MFGVRYMRDCPPLPAGRSPKGRGGRTKIFRLFEYERDARSIKAESDLDGICVTRISLAAEELGAENCARVCKSLRTVGRAFRTLKTGRLEVRPIHRRPSAGASVLAHAGLPCRVAHVRGMAAADLRRCRIGRRPARSPAALKRRAPGSLQTARRRTASRP